MLLLYRDHAATLCSIAAAVLLEAVAEDIREYLRSRRDTIRCIVTMLTDDSSGANSEGEGEGESLFEELKRTVADEVTPSLPQLHVCPRPAGVLYAPASPQALVSLYVLEGFHAWAKDLTCRQDIKGVGGCCCCDKGFLVYEVNCTWAVSMKLQPGHCNMRHTCNKFWAWLQQRPCSGPVSTAAAASSGLGLLTMA